MPSWGVPAETVASGWGVALATVNAAQTILLAWLAGEHIATRRARRNGDCGDAGTETSSPKSARSPD